VTLRQFLHGILLLSVLYMISGTTGDPDLWGHVRFGQDMVAHGAVRLPDTYSFTTDRTWINHEWLGEVLFARAFNFAGPAGLNLLRILAIAGVLGLVWRATALLSERRRLMLVAACGLGIYMRAHPIRPQLFSLLMFAILLMLLKRADDARSLRPIALVPVVMAAWVNLHGGWLVGLGFFGLWCVQFGLARPWRDRLALAAALTVALASTLINPFGLGMWDFLATTVRLERPMIADWQPLYELPFIVWISWLIAFAVLAVGAAHARSRADCVNVAIVALFGAAAMRVSRLDAFFALAAVFLGARLLRQQESAVPTRARELRPSMTLATAFGLCGVITAVLLVPRVRTVPVPDELVPDSNVAAFVRDEKLKGNVLTWFTWGQYSIWHFGPDLKVSMDGRRETVYGPGLISAHLEFYFGTSDEWRYADALKADYVWIPKHLPVARTLQLNGWHPLCEGQSSILLTRQSAHPRCSLRAEEHGRSFPHL